MINIYFRDGKKATSAPEINADIINNKISTKIFINAIMSKAKSEMNKSLGSGSKF